MDDRLFNNSVSTAAVIKRRIIRKRDFMDKL
jgi:hypothetical protein